MAFSVTYGKWYVETTHQAAGFIYTIPGFGTIGLQAIYFDFGEIEKTINPTSDQIGSYINLGTYQAGSLVLGMTYARQLTDKFAFGSSIKFVRESIDIYHASNIISDIGFLYQTGFKSLRIGSFLQNFGLESKYANEKFKMPQQLKLGLSAELLGNLESKNHVTLLIEAVHPNDADERIHLGVEGVLINSISLRGGYKLGYEDENLCLGCGLRFEYHKKKMGLDFSYMNHKRLANTIRYSLIIEW
jgi:hypothetical protein